MNPAWQPQSYQLRYEISYFRFWNAKIPVLARNGWLDYPDHVSTELTPPADALTDDKQGFVIHSLPFSGELSEKLFRKGDYWVYVERAYPRYLTHMNTSFEEYQQKFSSKTRSTIKRKIKKFETHCEGLVWKQFRTAQEMDAFYADARTVSKTTYQEKLLENGLPADEAFKREMYTAANADSVRAFVLYDKARPVAYLYTPVENGDLMYSYLGYDPEYLHLSPGTVLQWLAFEVLFAEQRYRFFDFTEGEGEHKKLFGTTCQQCVTAVFFKATLKNRLMLGCHCRLNALAEQLGAMADRYDLRAKVKRMLRLRK